MSVALITSLAILRVNYEKNRNYLDNFIPFLVECLRLNTNTYVVLDELKEDIEQHFGMSIPYNVLENLLKRLRKKGFIKSEHKTYIKVIDSLDSTQFKQIQNEMMIKHAQVINKLHEYVKERFQNKNLIWDKNNVEDAFNKYLREHHYLVIESITNSNAIRSKDNSQFNNNFIIGSFIKKLVDEQDVVLDYIVDVVKGDMIAQALYFSTQNELSKRFKGTGIYFDTTFLVYALGYTGKTREDPCVELIELLKETGAQIYCFRQTLGEITSIIESCIIKIKRGQKKDNFGTLEYFISNNMSAADLEFEIQQLEDKLYRELGIMVKDNPPYTFDHNIDVSGLTEYLKSNILYRSTLALDNDVESINSISRLRNGIKKYQVEECKAIFVTTNTILTYRVNEFFRKDYNGRYIPLSMTDIDLTTILWLKKPSKWPNLPLKRVIADSFASIQPTERQWNEYMIEVEKLKKVKTISEEQYVILKQADTVPLAIMEATLGIEEEIFTKGTIDEIYRLVEERIKMEEKEKNQLLLNELEITKAMTASTDQILQNTKKQIETDAERLAYNVVSIIFYLIISCIGLVDLMAITLLIVKLEIYPRYISYVLFGFQILLVFIFGMANKVYGLSINDFRGKAFKKLYLYLINKKKKKYDDLFIDNKP